MYTSFRVRGFRCFEDLELEGLERVNLIAGKNGVGKTALLEALFLHCGGYNPSLALRLRAYRGYENERPGVVASDEAPWQSIFRGFDTSAIIEMDGGEHGRGSKTVRLQTVEDPSELLQVPGLDRYLSDSNPADGYLDSLHVLRLEYQEGSCRDECYFVVGPGGIHETRRSSAPSTPILFRPANKNPTMLELTERFGKLEKAGEQEQLVSVLRTVEPRLRRLATVVVIREPVLHGAIGEGPLIPILEMGGGAARLADLALAIRQVRDGVALVDEFENGLHYSVLEKVWRTVAEAARKFNVQVFATTHSWECITAAHGAFCESGTYDFKLHRLDTIAGAVRAVSYDQELIEAAMETGTEIR